MSTIKDITKLFHYFVKKEFFLAVFVVVLISLFDLLTISLLLPLMDQLVNSGSREIFFGIQFFSNFFNYDFIQKNLIKITLLVFTISLFLQYFFRVFRVYLMNRISKNYNNFFINNYSNINFLNFKKKKLSEIFNSFNTYSDRIVNHVIDSSITIISGVILIIILTIPLVIFDTFNFFLTLFLLLFFLTFLYQSLKKIISKVGEHQLFTEKKKTYHINFIYNFFSNLKINLRLKNLVVKEFYNNINMLYKSNLIGSSILYLPKLLVELVIIFFIFFYFIKFDSEFVKYIPELTIYLFIFYKSFPHIIMINTCYKRIKIANFFIKNTLTEIKILRKNIENYPDHSKLEFNKNIIIKNIKFFFDNKKSNKVEFQNIKFEKNKKYLLMGKSGSGKSTFLNIISGLIFFKNFQIFYDNKSINFKNLTGYRKLFSVYDGKDILIPGTLFENIALDAKINKKSLKFALDNSGLLSLFNKKLIKKNFNILGNGENISAGQRQLLCVARCLYQNKDLLILDEPTRHLDHKTTIKLVKNLIKLNNKTVIMISHDQTVKRYFDKILNFKNFKISYEE